MKDNKINIDLIVPNIGEKYNVFIPVNKTIGEIVVILNNTINEITGYFPLNDSLCLYDIMEGKIYDYNTKLIDTNIRNGAFLALI